MISYDVKNFHLSPPLESRIDFEVEDAEGNEGDDAGNDQLGQVVVVEDVVLWKPI